MVAENLTKPEAQVLTTCYREGRDPASIYHALSALAGHDRAVAILVAIDRETIQRDAVLARAGRK